MTRSPATDLADALTGRILAVHGVRGLFPSHAVAAAVLTALSPSGGDPRVAVSTEEGVIRIAARLATDRTTPSRHLLARVADAVAATVGDHPYTLQVELAHID